MDFYKPRLDRGWKVEYDVKIFTVRDVVYFRSI